MIREISSVQEVSSPTSEHKKRGRPSPIAIPSPPPLRLAPGPNAFAIAERSQLEEADSQQETAICHQGQQSVTHTPMSSPLEGPHPLQTASYAGKERQRSSGMTTLTQLIDHARSGMSPRKSDGHVSSTTSRHESTTRSRHSDRSRGSHRSGMSGHPLGGNEMTARAMIEGRAEKRFFDMMGQPPSTPTSDIESSVIVQVHDLSSKGTRKKADETPAVKSPKKKIFGVSIPNFMSSTAPSNPEPIPPMPSKAAQLLGMNPASKRQQGGSSRPFRIPHSETSKSLPAKVYDQQNQGQRQHHSGSARTRPRAPARSFKAQSPSKGVQWQGIEVVSRSSGSLDLGTPPTPPQKDTPPTTIDKENYTESHSYSTYQASNQNRYREHEKEEEEYGAQDVFVDRGMNLQHPLFATAAKPIPSDGGESPTKFRPYGAEDYVKLIEGDRVGSMNVEYGYADVENGNHSAPLHGEEQQQSSKVTRSGRWSEEKHAQHRGQLSNPNGRIIPPALPPVFYSPSTYSLNLFSLEEGGRPSKNTNYNRLLFAVPPKKAAINPPSSFNLDLECGDIGIIFQGTASEMDPDSDISKMIDAASRDTALPRKNEEMGLPNQAAGAEQSAGSDKPYGYIRGSDYHQPEHSSSRLTDMLSGVSPSKVNFAPSFIPNCPSAVPSPLHAMSGQQASNQQTPPPAMMRPPPASMGHPPSPPSLLHHFHMTNEHIDVSGRTLYDFVAECNHQTLAMVHSKHDNIETMLMDRFGEIKTLVKELTDNVNHNFEQNRGVNEKLDTLLDFIKADVVEPMATQAKKTADMESSIKALQKAITDLEQSVETNTNPTLGPGQSSLTQLPQFPLPQHRSQPSLAGFYESPHEPIRDGSSRLPPMQDNRSDGRVRHPFNNGNNGHQWSRPPGVYRENTRDAPHPFSGTNPYNNATNFGGGYTESGYPGYPYPVTPESNFNYNTPK